MHIEILNPSNQQITIKITIQQQQNKAIRKFLIKIFQRNFTLVYKSEIYNFGMIQTSYVSYACSNHEKTRRKAYLFGNHHRRWHVLHRSADDAQLIEGEDEKKADETDDGPLSAASAQQKRHVVVANDDHVTRVHVHGRVLGDTWVMRMQTSRWSGHDGLLEAKVSGPRAPGYAISSLHLFNERENSIR